MKLTKEQLRRIIKEEFGQVNEGDKVDAKISHFKKNPEQWGSLKAMQKLTDLDELDISDWIGGGGFPHTDKARDFYMMSGGWDMDGSRERYYPGWTDDDFKGLVISVDGYDLFQEKNPYWEEGDYFEEQRVKLTKETLKRIIKEELGQVVESDPSQEPGWGSGKRYDEMSKEYLIQLVQTRPNPKVYGPAWDQLVDRFGMSEEDVMALRPKKSMKET